MRPPSFGSIPPVLPRAAAFARRRSVPYSASWPNTATRCWRHGMTILERVTDERVSDVRISDDTLTVDLMYGRTIAVPTAWYPRLAGASPEQRANWTICGGGYGIHWPD